MPDSDLSLPIIERVDAAADRFEVAWRTGVAPQIEVYLATALASDRDALLVTLLGIELELRVKAGESVELESLWARFPGRDEIIVTAFAAAYPSAKDTATPGSSIRIGLASQGVGDRVEVPGYEVLGELGRGAMGVVYRARQVGLNRVVALKMILAGEYAHPEAVARFLTEAGLAARIQHPNIVPVYVVGSAGGRPYFSLEYVAGGSLADRLRGEPQVPADAARLVETLARAMHHAHLQGVIHRDLKPANVLLAQDGTPKITDFGLARSDDGGLTVTGAILGTPCYMAPEQAEGRKGIGPAADVYALGSILYECLTGRPPFRGSTAVETIDQVRTRDPVSIRALRPGVPRDLETIAMACLQKEPDRRYPTAEVLANDLALWLGGRPIVARPVGLFERAWNGVRRNRAASAAVAAIVLGSLATAVTAVIAFEQTRQAADDTARRLEAERDTAVAQQERVQLQVRYREMSSDAIRRGKPRDVLAVVQRAEQDGFEITPEMRFEEAAAIGALGQSEKAREKWTNLLATKPPPDLRARMELRLGAELIGIDDEQATQLIDQALASIRLAPADRSFAEATRAQTLTAALERLELALGYDPTHFPAKHLLALMLMTSGQLAKASRAAEDMRLMVPDSPYPLWILLFVQGLAGDSEATLRVFEQLKPHVTREIERPNENLAKQLPLLRNAFMSSAGRAALRDEPTPQSVAVIEFPTVVGANPLVALQPLPFRRLPRQFRDSADDLWFLIRSRGQLDVVDELANNDALRERFAADLARRPEGFKQFVYAIALMERAMNYLSANGTVPPHGDRTRKLIAETGDAHAKAATTPALLDVRAYALEGAIMSYTIAGRPAWPAEPDLAILRTVSDLLRVRLKEPEAIPLTSIDFMVRAAKQADLSIARVILDDWSNRKPGDITVLRHQADVEFRSEAFEPALRAAEKILIKKTDDAAARKIRDQSRAKLGLPPIP